MVIDLGSHWLDGLSNNAVMPGSNPTAMLQGVRLTQIVTRQLAPRAAHFPPLATSRQVRVCVEVLCSVGLCGWLATGNSRADWVVEAYCVTICRIWTKSNHLLLNLLCLCCWQFFSMCVEMCAISRARTLLF